MLQGWDTFAALQNAAMTVECGVEDIDDSGVMIAEARVWML